jgi:hypothetical protein
MYVHVYLLFRPLKKHLLGQHFTSHGEVHNEIRCWLMGLDTDFFCSSVGNPVRCWYKYLI